VALTGESVGVKAGGMLEFLTQKLDIVCLPKHLPETIAVDITTVGVGKSLHVGDLKLPEGVKATTDSKVTVMMITEVIVEETPAAAAKDAKGKKPAAKAAKK
jgi:large subunit ribosomal protein L25